MKVIRFVALGLVLGATFAVGAVGAAQDTTSETVHVIQPGENLFRIALNYGLTTDELAAANEITDPTRIQAGQTLVIPGAAAPAAVVDEETTPVEVVIVPNGDEAATGGPEATEPEAPEIIEETRPVYHTISRGESLRAIAQQYDTTEQEIISLNNIANPNRILAGQQLLIRNEPIPTAEEVSPVEAVTPAEAAPEAEATTHIVQQGEHLSSIARRYGVTNDLIIAANSITNPNQVYAGQELVIPAGLSVEEANEIIHAPPEAKIGTGREIIVDLGNSRVYAYENGILMYEAVSSNGLPATPTVQGNFTVQRKVRSQTMSGPGYWLPNVEWVLYFYQGYALHSAYWHDNFGQPMSHGCVNLRNEDAKWFYEFAEIGTPVTVQI